MSPVHRETWICGLLPVVLSSEPQSLQLLNAEIDSDFYRASRMAR